MIWVNASTIKRENIILTSEDICDCTHLLRYAACAVLNLITLQPAFNHKCDILIGIAISHLNIRKFILKDTKYFIHKSLPHCFNASKIQYDARKTIEVC